jgi:hypothetical protein
LSANLRARQINRTLVKSDQNNEGGTNDQGSETSMATSLFHIALDGSLSVMREASYDSEDHIQRLIAEHPEVLAGEQFSGQEPRRWFLVGREISIPDGENASSRWSIDHLYLDQDAIPTLVEVKRRSDSRSRREVVGQMFDYAANGPTYWTIAQLRASFASTHALEGASADEVLRRIVGDEVEPEIFWQTVEENLRAGRVRMVFVVDDMPPELQKIVSFLSHQLRDAEVYAVEVRQHVGPSGQVLATTVIGQNLQPQSRSARTMSPVMLDDWVKKMNSQCSAEERGVLEALMNWMQMHASSTFVTVAQNPSFGMSVKEDGQDRYPFGITPNKKAAVYLGYLSSSNAYADKDDRQKIVDAISATGLLIGTPNLNGDIRIPLKDLADSQVRLRFLGKLEEVVGKLKAC